MRLVRCSCRLARRSSSRLPSPPPPRPSEVHALGAIGFGGAALIAGDQILIGRPGTLIGFPIPAESCRRGPRLPPRGRSLDRDGDDGARRTAPWVMASARRSPPTATSWRSGRRATRLAVPSTCSSAAPAGRWTRAGPPHLAAKRAEGDRLRRRRWRSRAGCCWSGRPGREGERGAVVVFGRGKGRRRMDAARASSRARAPRPSDWFGAAVAFDGQRALVGAPGGLEPAIPPGGGRAGLRLPRAQRACWTEEGRLVSDRRTPRASLGRGRAARRRRGAGRRAAGGQHGGRRGCAIRRDGARAWSLGRHASLRTRSPVRPASGPRWRATATTCWSARRCPTRAPAAVLRAPPERRTEWKQVQLLVTPPAGYSTRLGAAIAAGERARRRRRAAGVLLRGHRTALSPRRRGRAVARDRRGERHHLRRRSPPCPAAR